jgi:DNA mismatch repair protein MutS
MTPLDVEQKTSPMMAQWQACKKSAGEAVLFFRMGDFYEAFYDDAVTISRELDLTLTKRQDIPMSGVPHHTSEAYIDKLVGKGYRVAVAEQTEDPKKTKGLVKREVIRVVTPGTLINSSLLSEKANNFFAALSRVGSLFGLAVLDLTTSDFRVIEFDNEQELLNEIYRLHPAEFLVSSKFQEKQESLFHEMRKAYDFLISTYEDWHFEHQITYNFLSSHLGVQSLDGFGLKGKVAGINAAGALLSYLQDVLCHSIGHIREIQTYSTGHYMSLDRATQRNLELTESLQDGSRRNTLLSILDKTRTPMGARLMRHWVKQPLLDPLEIAKRQDAVQSFFGRPHLLEQVIALLEGVRDLERLMMKISSGYASPRDVVALRFSFEPIPLLKAVLQNLAHLSSLIHEEEQKLEALPEMTHLIATAIVDDPPARLSDGKIFRDGYHRELDELREISRDSKSWIARYQSQLRETTGIKTIKVGFTKMFGYYIEVSKGQAERMPDIFQRRQTLVNAERYVTPELKEYENKVLHAEERMASIESELFAVLRHEVAKNAERVQRIAQALARIDAIQGMAAAARQHEFSRPVVDQGTLLQISEGRHPIIEVCHGHERFVPNDTLLDDSSNRLFLITGPNMAGKSTYIRQVALIAIGTDRFFRSSQKRPYRGGG